MATALNVQSTEGERTASRRGATVKPRNYRQVAYEILFMAAMLLFAVGVIMVRLFMMTPGLALH